MYTIEEYTEKIEKMTNEELIFELQEWGRMDIAYKLENKRYYKIIKGEALKRMEDRATDR